MRIALISDIHANLSALEAVLAEVRRQKPDLILSMGDQVGMGPKPTEVLDLLRREGIPSLLGNHEMRVLSLRADQDPMLREDINFALARWNTEMLAGYELDFPMEWETDTPAGRLFLTHAGLGDPYARIEPEGPSLQTEVLDGLLTVQAEMIAVGHSHYPYVFQIKNRPIVVVGSVGMAHNHVPGTAEYTMLEADSTGFLIHPRVVAYDRSKLRQQFQENRLKVYDPVMARVTYEAMAYNENRIEPFVRMAAELARAEGTTRITPAVWEETAARFEWLEPGRDCERYWREG